MAAIAVAAGTLTAVAPIARAEVVAGAPIVISEVYGGGGNSGATYKRDFVELHNVSAAPVQLAGHSVQYASATGSSWQVTLIPTVTIPPDGYLLVAEASGAGGTTDVAFDVDGSIAMSGTAGKVALVSVTAPLTCGTGCAALTPVVDLVGFGGTASSFAGSGPAPAPSNANSTARVGSNPSTADNAADFVAGTPTPTTSVAGPVDPPEPPVTVTIAEIQGVGDASTLVGDTVITSGVVTASYPAGGFSGYVLQTAGTGGGDIASRTGSDAIFVFSPATVAQATPGTSVRVTGAVSEFNGLTELTVAAGDLEVLSDPVSPVVPIEAPWPATSSEREKLESMVFQPIGPFTVSNTFSTNQYGEVGLASGTIPLIQPTDVARPNSPDAAVVMADNAARAVTLDDGSSVNFLSAANSALTPPYVSLTEPVRVGAAATFPQPLIVDYRNNTWKLQPTSTVTSTTDPSARPTFVNDRTAAPDGPALGDADLVVASFNVLNYFTTLGSTVAGCVPYNDRVGDGVTVQEGCAPRGAWDAADLARQQAKIVAAINLLDADVVGLMEIENSAVLGEVPDEAVSTLVAALNDAAGAGTWAYVPSSADLPPVAEMDVINNAIIYRTASVAMLGPSHALGDQSGDGEAFDNAREPIAQAFSPLGGGEPFAVVVNHFKSKGSGTGADADAGDGQGASNNSRVRQATALRDWIPGLLASYTDTSVDDLFLVGDFNSYTDEDPLHVLYDAGYVDVNAAFGDDEYSYSFSGLSGSLDHVIANAAAMERVTGSDIWNINSPESIALEYSRYNYHGSLFYEATPFRSSDHDPVLAGFTFGIVPAVSTTTLVASASSQTFGTATPVSVTATVVLADATAPDGTVDITLDGALVATLPASTATFTLPASTPVGPHELVATYSGSATSVGSVSASVSVTVTAAPLVASRTVLTTSKLIQLRGASAKLTAKVTAADGAAVGGTVTFVANGVAIGTAPVTGGKAVFTVPANAPTGIYFLSATYGGSATVAASTSNWNLLIVLR